MPEYSQIYRQGLRAYEPTTGEEVAGTLDPERRYNLQFYSEPTTNVTGQEYQGLMERTFAEQQRPQQTQIPEWSYTTRDLADNDYQTGMLSAQNEYLEEMKVVDNLPPGSQQHILLSQLAAQKLQAKNAELNMNKQKWDNVRRTIRQDDKYSGQNRYDLESQWYAKNRIFEPKTIKTLPSALTPQQQIAQRKLARIDELQQKIDTGTATAEEESIYNKMLGGGAMVEIGLGKPASAAERTDIAEARVSMDALNNLRQLYDTGGFGEAAPVSGRLAPITGLFGMTTDQQEAFMAATSAFKNAIIKQITGAQMSEPEARRIMKQIPDITDPPARWKAKWEESLKNVRMMEQRKLEVLRQSGLRVPENQSVIDMIQSAGSEELFKLAGIE
jgi:hypothetical protein